MTILDRLADDAGALISDPVAWWAVAVAVMLIALSTSLGIVLSLRIGLLTARSTRSSTFGVGLGLGLLAVAASYAAIRSTGASAYVPTVVFLMMALIAGRGRILIAVPGRRWLWPLFGVGVALIALAFLFGTTISPSPRGGLQPVEFMDEAYFGVLGSILKETGNESLHLPAGFGVMPGFPERSWYHWGELWLASLVLEVPGVTAMAARHLTVLPLVIIATATIVGSVAARGWPNRLEPVLLGAIGLVGLAPVPLVLEWHFDWWARAIGFSVTSYGLAYIVIALAIYVLLDRSRTWDPARILLMGALTAALVASHIVVAAVAAVGVAAAGSVLLATREPDARIAWIRSVGPAGVVAGVAGTLALAYGSLTGHGLGGDGRVVGIVAFGEAWWRGIGLSLFGAGLLIVGPVLAVRQRAVDERLAALAVGAAASTIIGALLWGWRLPEFNAFHAYYGPLAVIVVPIAVLGTIAGIRGARLDGRRRLAAILVAMLIGQSAIGIGATIQRLYEFGPGHYAPIPVAMLEWIRQLPEDAKLAYACAQVEEIAVWDARLVSITAHTGRPVVPMCYQRDVFAPQLGHTPYPTQEGPYFRHAPQRELFPTFDAEPSPETIRAFLIRHGIKYLWVDPDHRTLLVPDAIERHRIEDFAVFEIPGAP